MFTSFFTFNTKMVSEMHERTQIMEFKGKMCAQTAYYEQQKPSAVQDEISINFLFLC